jgi:hypothetical protein
MAPDQKPISNASASSRANPGNGYGAGVGEADPLAPGEPDALDSGDPESDGCTDGDELSEAEGTGMDGIGRGVGSGTKRDGISKKLRTKIATKITRTAMSHGRAKRSLRVGRAPR